MRTAETDFKFAAPWAEVTAAFFNRYPNPFSRHVLSSDVIGRHVDAQGRLHSTRLHLKGGSVPRWARGMLSGFFKDIQESYVLEHSLLDPATQTLLTVTENIDHRRVMTIVEDTRYTAQPDGSALSETRYTVTHGPALWPLVGNRLEQLVAVAFKSQMRKSRQGLEFVLGLFHDHNRSWQLVLEHQRAANSAWRAPY